MLFYNNLLPYFLCTFYKRTPRPLSEILNWPLTSNTVPPTLYLLQKFKNNGSVVFNIVL